MDNYRGNPEAAKREVAASMAKHEASKREFSAWPVDGETRPHPNTAELTTRAAPVPESTRILQAFVGGIVGGVIGIGITFLLAYVVRLFFYMGATHVRVPLKGMLLGLLAPIGGIVVGAVVGWNFDSRNADWLRRRPKSRPT